MPTRAAISNRRSVWKIAGEESAGFLFLWSLFQRWHLETRFCSSVGALVVPVATFASSHTTVSFTSSLTHFLRDTSAHPFCFVSYLLILQLSNELLDRDFPER